MERYDLKQGEHLLKTARNAIEIYTRTPHFSHQMFENRLRDYGDEHGVYIRLQHYPTRTLRGIAGFHHSSGPIHQTLVAAAISAANQEKKFVPVSHLELDDLTVELNLLSKPELIKGSSIDAKKKEIKIGRDGLVLQYGYHKGIMLASEPTERNLTKDQFLDDLCVNAGLPSDAWKRHDVTLYRFTTQTFRETEPNGPIEEINQK